MSNIPVRKRSIAEEKITTSTPPEAEQRLLDFVEQQIDKMRNYSKLNAADGQPGFYELNKALSEHQLIWLSLVALNAVAKTELAKTKENFDDWFASKYISIRDELNPRSVSATKWYSTKEVEMHVRVKYREEFHEYDRKVTYAEQKVAHIRRLMEGWQTQHFNLSRLSKNVEAEYGSGQLEDQLF